ncbi:GH36-type glycosyl hydrolase domain-containing protein [uncultured Hydrogenophaga sp.]|uniref:GH36-type glycosyl hydrolase domain-containing protein n=1 Tax=uncultured Hydrogenophaga sp. TaxID=199683 RepID=UPI00265D7D60|nr:glucoamylase family protein [uncultured Hydrogenophaga sp.]
MGAQGLRRRWPWIPADIDQLLRAQAGPALEPLRLEIFGVERLCQHARSLAQAHTAQQGARARSTFWPRLQNNIRALRQVHAQIARQARDEQEVGPAAAWLLDNFHLIDAQLQTIHQGLPPRFYRSLPVLCDPPLAGLPRIYGIAWAFVAHTDSAFDENLLLAFLAAYQDTRELGQGELWALPTTLRLVLVENLRRLAERIAAHRAATDLASWCARRMSVLTLPTIQALSAALLTRDVGAAFQVQLLQALAVRTYPADAVAAQVHDWLLTELPDLPDVQQQQHARQAADLLSVGNAVTALRLIGAADWSDLVDRSSHVVAALMASTVFAAEDDDTRSVTLHAIERLARQSGRPESAVAGELLRLMQQQTAAAGSGADASPELAAHWLQGDGQAVLRKALGLRPGVGERWRHRPRATVTQVYLGVLAVATGVLVAWLLQRWAVPADTAARVGLALLVVWPASEVVMALVVRLAGESVRPAYLSRLLLPDGIPARAQVLVVVPALLSDTATVQALVHRLEQHYLANPERHAQFGLLTDWCDAPAASMPGDDSLLELARAGVAGLNRDRPAAPAQAVSGPRFVLLHRPRTWSDSEQCWLGHERKRGKIEALIARLATGHPGPFLPLGDLSRTVPHTCHVLTLDSDTVLPPGRLRALVGVAEHPLNQPRLDADGRSVLRGVGIVQPRLVAPLPEGRFSSAWAWLGRAGGGLDAYSAMASDLYQDLWGRGSFTGKGLLHVATLHAVLGGRLPAGSVLSHDLLEGALVRCAVASDITLLEPEPTHADAVSARQHRWMRGDWQLLPFLLAPRAWPMAGIDRWKMADNLRRSLVAPASLALLLLSMGGAGLTWPAAWALVLAALRAGPVMAAVASLVPHRRDRLSGRFVELGLRDVWRALLATLWQASQLPAQALLALDAVLRTGWRLGVSRRHLLAWSTSAATQRGIGPGWRATLWRHRAVPVVMLLLLAATAWPGGLAPPHASGPLQLAIGLWACGPLLVWLVHRPWRVSPALRTDDARLLHGVARDTWRLFERCVTAHDHHLPPDNLQLWPLEALAHRTSPTNIGLYLLSAVSARAFGWIGTQDLLQRLEATWATLQQLERHQGHFLNWYDTETLAPLLPRYVSTVDSGNLAVHLLAVAQACRALAHDPLDPATSQDALARSEDRLRAHRGPEPWLEADHQATEASAQLDREALAAGQAGVAAQRLLALADAVEALAWAPDFGVLYQARKRLFHIGLRVDEQLLDPSFYDLLASEARSTSLMAIAKGDVPLRHWVALGRPAAVLGRHAALLSWSGSMFEYLMPLLVSAPARGSALDEAARSAVREQQAHGHALGVAWGMSECAHAARDPTLAYQYGPQGVPRLALRRIPFGECVVAPYATALAAQVDAAAACRNLRRLAGQGARGRYGFIEALDHTPERQLHGHGVTLVVTFMAHHQGMVIAALANVLLDGLVQRWGMADVRMQAVASLLQEPMPRELQHLRAFAPAPRRPEHPERAHRRTIVPGAQALEPTHLLSNGRHTVTLRANGAGWSRRGAAGISRHRDDALRDEHGSFIYLRAPADATPVSVSSHPAPDPQASYSSEFQVDRVLLHARWPTVQATTTVWVSPEDDIELRKVVVANTGHEAIDIEVLSALDITLAAPAADEAHPAFSNFFVRADWLPAQQALRFERRPRLATEQGLLAAHFVASADARVLQLRCQTDRLHWRGRGRPASQPQGLLMPAPEEPCSLDTGLDPVAVLGLTLRLEPGTHATVVFATAASDSPSTLAAVIDKYREPGYVERSSVMSATLAAIPATPLRPHTDYLPALHALTTALVFTLPRVQAAAPATAASAPVDPRLLWPLGISGARPLILVHAVVVQGMGLLRLLALMLREWQRAGVACDLVLLNHEAASYDMPLQRELMRLRDQHAAHPSQAEVSACTALHTWRLGELSSGQVQALRSLACVTLAADGHPLLHQVRDWCQAHEPQAAAGWHRTGRAAAAVRVPVGLPGRFTPAPAQPAQGRFVDGGRAFEVELGPGFQTPKPWINVLANPGLGCLLSESGAGPTWARNSRLDQLTTWSNDPVADTPGEWWLLQDRASQRVWSLVPSAWGHGQARYRVTHAQGLTSIVHEAEGLRVAVHWCVDPVSAIKQVRVQVHNTGPGKRHLRLVALVEWLMGERRADRSTLHTRAVPRDGQELAGLFCSQTRSGAAAGTAFLAEVPPPRSGALLHGEGPDWTCDRRALFDAAGQLVLPRHLGRASGPGVDPCAAHARLFTLRPGAHWEQTWLIGHADTVEDAQVLLDRAVAVDPLQREADVAARWDVLLGATEVHTPDPLFDALVNRWLLYQTLSCRLWAKAGFYQAGGATGFRDQLQDAMALLGADPALLRSQIVRCAARQFEAGDVQHWWHEPGGAGVRTHFSDDLLWLPMACAHYLRGTGDLAVLEVVVPFLDAPALPPGVEDAYDTPAISDTRASVYEHAARAIDHSLRVGVHGLPLMGTGDWNDGMNRVGHEGRGESVWLAWFLCSITADWIPLARQRGDLARALRWARARNGWTRALETHGWDGAWYRRAFFDDGSPLGAACMPEARIDLIAQAWAVLSGCAPLQRQQQAMASARELLHDPASGLMRLLVPPLQQAVPAAGYIQAYPPGVRENGGQYAHAAVWGVMAVARLAVRDHARDGARNDARDAVYRRWCEISPAHRSAHPVWGPPYGLEPYAVAADVYGAAPWTGRGGWSWYTGAAGWLHRAALESLFGLQMTADELWFEPCLPTAWPSATLTLRRHGRELHFLLHRDPLDTSVPAAAGPAEAGVLRVGERLRWRAVASGSRYRVFTGA